MSTFNDIPTAVGRSFVKVYYQRLYSDLATLFKLYNPEAIRTKASLNREDHSESWVGIKEIKESFEKKGSGYKNVKIIAADFQPSYAGSILVTVSGTLMEDDDNAVDSISFVQVFVLVPAQAQSWAIQNDILRLDTTHLKEEAKINENVENSREVPAPVAEIEVPSEKQEQTNENVEENVNTENENQPEPQEEVKEIAENNNETNEESEANSQNGTKTAKEEESIKPEEEKTKTVSNESENQQNKIKKTNNKKYFDKNSPKSKNWGNRQNQNNQQQNNNSSKPNSSAGNTSTASSVSGSAPTTPSYADIAKKIAAAGALNPPSSVPVPHVNHQPAPSSSASESSNSESHVPSSAPVTQKEQLKNAQVQSRPYKDSPSPFRKDPPASGLNKTVVARNLPASTTKESLKAIFEEFGSVTSVHITATAVAFIEFADPTTAQTVLLRVKTTPVLVDGKEIRIEAKKKKPNNNKGSGLSANVNNNNNRKKEYRVRGNNDSSNNNTRGN